MAVARGVEAADAVAVGGEGHEATEAGHVARFQLPGAVAAAQALGDAEEADAADSVAVGRLGVAEEEGLEAGGVLAFEAVAEVGITEGFGA
jgi:hypothetical protein